MIGKRINDRYQIISRVGDGGMAVVYKAKDLILDRVCAVKVLRQEFSNDEAFIRRFRREAEAVSSLSHTNIINIYDIGEEDDLYYIVMEYIDGVTLKTYINEYAPLPSENAVYILKQIASAIEHAHQHGIVHRDIKPQNILIDEQDHVKVTDFGIALAMTSATITYTNSIMGSAHYLSPEQAKGGKATIKSDVYAFGIVMYEMLTGQLPFPGDTPVTVALKHLNDPYVLPRELMPAIPQSLENIIIKSLAKNPDQRYETMGDVYDDLSTALDPERVNEPRLALDQEEDAEATKIIPIPPAPPPAKDDDNSDDHPHDGGAGQNGINDAKDDKAKGKKNKKKKRWLIWTIVLLIIAILAIVAFYLVPKLLAVENVQVPKVTGKTYDQAVELLKDKHLSAKREYVTQDDAPKGVVVDQSPDGGTKVTKGAKITLYVNKGPQKEEIQNYVGYDVDTVKELLKDSDYQIVWKGVPSTDAPKRQIIAQKPDPGTKSVPAKTILEFTYSTGPPTSKVPDVNGDSKDDAESTLKNEGFDVKFTYGDYSNDVAKDHVLKTSPAAGTEMEQGKTITVYLSKGPKEESKTIYKSITVTVDQSDVPPGQRKDKPGKGHDHDQQEVHVQIYFTDANNNHKLFKDERINQTTTYNLPLTIKPGGKASYQVIVDDQVIQDETINYGDI
ncbi:Stk1 family PASTA domain-containing Ser/Thr kinase [Camelliibacillus cellulosilyticus]|uniref:non-specific serine/threonine protein kinase n=1 Tax=Camelliibacillus cellulosilyticus TaxID=2174486 RepID=A0ABV9GKA7_9BACL